MQRTPEPWGYLPDGDTILVNPDFQPALVTDGTKEPTNRISDEVDLEPIQALKTPAFWLLGLAFSLRFMVVNSIALHFIPFGNDIGLSPQTVAFVLALLAGLGLMGRLAVGGIGDIFNKHYLLAAWP